MIPLMRNLTKFVSMLLLAFMLLGCGAQVQSPAPPAGVDLVLAKSLADSQAAIEQAKTLAGSNPGIKDPLNKIIAAYNAAETAYLSYHSAVASGGNPDPAALQAQVSQLAQNIAALITLYGKKPQ